jgi:hypothetical protein
MQNEPFGLSLERSALRTVAFPWERVGILAPVLLAPSY